MQVTNLVQRDDGKKPRIANDYNKKLKSNAGSGKIDIAKLDALVRDATIKLS